MLFYRSHYVCSMFKKKQQKKLDYDNIKRASSELSYFNAGKEEPSSVLDKVWRTLSFKEQIDTLLHYHDDKGRGIFILAVRDRDYETIEELLNNKHVDVNEQDIYGNTALHHAILVKDGQTLQRLLNSERIDPNRVNKDRRSVRAMLEALEDTDTFDESIYTYCYARLPYRYHY